MTEKILLGICLMVRHIMVEYNVLHLAPVFMKILVEGDII